MSIVYSAECKELQRSTSSTGMLPVLVVLFVISYVILTLVVIEQNRTIESQRGLIHEMLNDSNQLAVLKGKIAQEEHLRSQKAPVIAVPSTPETQAGSSKSGKDSKGGKSPKAMQQAPTRPQSDLEDVRRSTRII